MGDIRMITGGSTSSSSKEAYKAYLQMIQNIQLIRYAPKMARVDNPIIGFTEEDARRLHQPHDDALVVNIWVGDYNIYRVLVDNRSSANILYYPAFQQMRVEKERLIPVSTSLVGFGGTRVYPLGVVTLPAVTSTYHLMIRFPTEYGVGEVRGDQVAVREYYIAMLEMDDHQQTMCIEEQRAAEPVEELEEVTLDDSRPEWTTRVGTLARQSVRNELMTFLRENQDVFTQSHKDMPGIDADFIREIYYPDWLANVVMVKKANGKWRMSVDFTDFNIACPKDSYPLPRIDTLVDSTARH
ncbi:uncharacterized protein LOC126712583 [Quercus robur]|uniref:uncharacterized protein LOC126712583 n=1 Tax=Quercus robur TaxID=38942 RepID=UPI002163DF68|nr:uncharacterized protein LOC126712583 [Quercus robur]